jgi:hypothetical protein
MAVTPERKYSSVPQVQKQRYVSFGRSVTIPDGTLVPTLFYLKEHA